MKGMLLAADMPPAPELQASTNRCTKSHGHQQPCKPPASLLVCWYVWACCRHQPDCRNTAQGTRGRHTAMQNMEQIKTRKYDRYLEHACQVSLRSIRSNGSGSATGVDSNCSRSTLRQHNSIRRLQEPCSDRHVSGNSAWQCQNGHAGAA